MSILLKGLLLIFLLFVINNSEIIAQNILNGDFENTVIQLVVIIYRIIVLI